MDEALQRLQEAQGAVDAAEESAASVVANQPWSPELVQFLAVSILAFTFTALVLASALLWRTRVSAPHVLKIFGIISIIGVSSVLLVTGYSNSQLTPIVGLFGAIAGYLLGRDSAPQASVPSGGRNDGGQKSG